MTAPKPIVRWMVPVVVAAVAGLQVWRVAELEQSSWAGVGFGMFATVDNHSSRFVRAVAVPADPTARAEVLRPPHRFRDLVEEIQVVPGGDGLEKLARRWAPQLDLFGEVRFQVWRVRLDGVGNPVLRPSLIREVVVDGSG